MGVRLAVPVLSFAFAACASDPVAPQPSGPWAQVSAGDQFTCALTTAGRAYCWGSAIFGQLGNGANTRSGVPVAVAGGHTFRTLASGSDHTCAIAVDGATWCWGLNDFLELGSPASRCNAALHFDCASAPVALVTDPRFDSIVVAGYTSCGLTSSGDAWCWGWSDHGQLGSVPVGDVTGMPTQVAGGRHFVSLSLDIYHACGATATHALYCWGSNIHGQIGADSTQTPRCGVGAGFLCAQSPVAAASGLPVSSASAGGTHTCAITTSFEAWCWGSNQDGVLGNPNALGGPQPVRVAGSHEFHRISAGGDHTCALDDAGALWCWGVNAFFQLGTESVAEACPAFGSAQPCRTSPGLVATTRVFTDVSAGTGHTCALTTGGEILCWGRGSAGQLGDGASTTSSVPVRVVDP